MGYDGTGERRALRGGARARRVLATVAVLLLVAWPTSHGASAATGVTITGDGLVEHMQALQDIADGAGGNRATDTPGYAGSLAYVTDRLEAAGYVVDEHTVSVPNGPVQTGPSSFDRILPTPRSYVEDVDYLQPEPGSPVDGGGPVVPVVGGCDPTDYFGLAPGDVALVWLTVDCDVSVQLFFAGMAEVGAVLFASGDGPGAPPEHVDIGGAAFGRQMPVLSLSADAGEELELLAMTDTVTVSIVTGWGIGLVESTNVLAELPGTSDEVVMVGAHLDSVPEGPGINDNGSGVAAVLELAEQLASAGVTPRRTIRFGFWAAEERGIIGSKAYVADLSATERSRIVAYLNLDMIGSPNWIRAVYDPVEAVDPASVSPGSQAITDLFDAHFAALGLPTVPVWTNGRSDDDSFARAGIPVGGVFSGIETKTPQEQALFGGVAGEDADPCYHQACDRLDNVDLAIATELAQAFADVTLELAGVDEPIPTTTAAPPAARVAPAFTG